MFSKPISDNPELTRLISNVFTWRNMIYGNTWYMTLQERQAQAESWARANVSTGDPRFD